MMGERIMMIDKNAIRSLIEHSEKRVQAFQEQIEIYTKEVHYLNGAISAWKIVLEKEEKDEEKGIADGNRQNDSEDNGKDRRIAEKRTSNSQSKIKDRKAMLN